MKKVLASLLVVFPSFIYAQVSFSELPGIPGGTILDLSSSYTDNRGRTYALVSQNWDSKGALYVADGNLTWNKVEMDPPVDNGIVAISNCENSYAPSFVTQDKLYFPLDNGSESWGSKALSVSPQADSKIRMTDDWIYMSSGNFLYRTGRDDNSGWDTFFSPGSAINDFAVHDNNVYAGTSSSIYVSTGGAFSPINTGIPFPNNKFGKIVCTGTKVYALLCSGNTSGGLYELDEGTTTWTQVADNSLTSPLNFDQGYSQYRLYAFPNLVDRVFIASNSNIVYMDSPNMSSGNWTNYNGIGGGGAIPGFTVTSSDILLIGYSQAGVYSSDDDGATWAFSSDGLRNSYVPAFTEVDGNLIALDGRGNAFVSATGYTWNRFSICSNCTMSQLHVLSTGEVLAIGTKVYLSGDKGETWSFVSNVPANEFRMVAGTADDSKIWAVAYNNIFNAQQDVYLSEDNGQSWTLQNFTNGPADPNYNIYEMVATDGGDLYLNISFQTPNTPSVVKKIASGTLAMQDVTLPDVDNIRSISELQNVIYVIGSSDNSGDSFLLFSDDGGQTWTSRIIDNSAFKTSNRFQVYSDQIIFAQSVFGDDVLTDFYLTTDGGNTWNTAFTGYNHQVFRGVVVQDDGTAFVCRDYGPVMRSNSSVFKPDEPSNLRSVSTTSNSVILQWEMTGIPADGFILTRRDPSDADFKVIQTDADNADRRYFIDPTVLQPETLYTYRILARNNAGASFSELNVTTSAVCSASVTIPNNRSWSAAITGGPSSANVAIVDMGGGNYSISDLTAGSVSAEINKSVMPGKFFLNCDKPVVFRDGEYIMPHGMGTWNGTNTIVLNWQLDLSNDKEQHLPYTPKELTLVLNSSDPAPDAPAQICGYVRTESSIEIKWNPGKYQDKFIIERATAAAGPFTEVGQVDYPSITFVDEGLSLGNVFHYRVKAQNGNVSPLSSAYSSTTTVTLSKPNFIIANTIVNDIQADAIGNTWADLDNDGDQDLILTEIGSTSNGPFDKAPLVFKNNGNGDFEAVAGAIPTGSFAGAAVGDYDNDGSVDLFMPVAVAADKFAVAQAPLLLHNNGNFSFTSVKTSGTTAASEYGAGVANWMDFNQDGELDLFVPYGNGNHKLFKANNPGSGFTDALTTEMTQQLSIKSSIWMDFDKDNDLDFFAVVQGREEQIDPDPNMPKEIIFTFDNIFFENVGGVYQRKTGAGFAGLNVAKDKSYSNACAADYDNDGDLDIYVTGENTSNLLFNNDGHAVFTKQAAVAGSPTETKTYPTMGANFADIDNDGDLDLIVLNAANSLKLWLNDGLGSFTSAGDELLNRYIAAIAIGPGLADYDNNGTLDVLIGESLNLKSPIGVHPTNVKLLKNNNAPGHWLEVKAVGTASNKSGIGVQIYLFANGKVQMRHITSSQSIGTYNSQIVHFGLGSSSKIDSIMVYWPLGVLQVLRNFTGDKLLTIYEDDVDPNIVSVTPADDQNHVSTFTTIGVEFDEVPYGVAGKNLKLYKVVGGVDELVETVDAGDGVVTDSTITFTPSAELAGLTEYKVVLEANSITDFYGNSFSDTDYSWTFTTQDNEDPIITFDQASFIAPGVGFNTLKLSAFASDNIDVASATMYYRGVGTTDFTVAVGVEGATTDEWKFTVNESAFPLGGIEYYFTAIDGSANEGRLPADGYFTKGYETEKPQITSTPLNLVAKGEESYVFSATVTDNKSVSSVKMYYHDLTSAEFIALTPDASTTYNFTLTEDDFAGEGIEFYFEATDPTGNTARLPATSTEFFTTSLDNDAPEITFVADDYKKFAETAVEITYHANAVDNLAVESVTIHYRKVAQEIYKTKTSVPDGSGDVSFKLTKADADFDGNSTVEYYFTATDESGNIAELKNSNGTTFNTSFEFPAGSAKLNISASNGAVSGYQIIAIPYEMNNRSIADNFGTELGNADNTKYRFLRYSAGPPERWEEYPGNLSTFSRGEGYFINSRNALAIELTDASAPGNTQSDPFTMNLAKGWNQIGNPYLSRIEWSDVQAANSSITISSLITFSGGTYGVSTGLDAFTGGFVHVDDAVTGFVIPLSLTDGRRQQETVSQDLSADAWELPIVLANKHTSHAITGIGMHLEASVSNDRFDGVPPPRFLDFIEMTTSHPEYFEKRLSKDIVPTQEEFVWEFAVVASTDENISLSWDNTGFGNNDKDLFLVDESQGVMLDMRHETVYFVNARQAARLKIYFGTDLLKKIKPLGLNLGKAFPNPTKGVTSIGFSLPEKSASYQVRLEVYDVLGRKVSSLLDGRFDPGFYQAEWDARGDAFVSGFYTYRLIATADGKEEVLTGKLLLNK